MVQLLNPWPDHDWMLEMARAPDDVPRSLSNWLSFPGSFPLHSNRGIRTHLYKMRAWVEPNLDLSWPRGLGRTGPANGHRDPMPIPLPRTIASRYNTWAVELSWYPDVKREGAAISDPA